MKNSVIQASLLASVALTAIIVPTPVLAQDSEPALEEITVTARRREERLQDTPVTITAFSANSLDKRGITDITELAQSLPSVTLEASRATNSTLTAFIRGVGQQDPLAGFEPGVALYIDDVYLARPQGALLEILDIERVEVLRGPQGTLYGRNAMGGAIKYVTKRLGDDPSFKANVRLGTYDQLDVTAAVSGALSETVKVGAAMARLSRGGFGENRTLGTENYNKDIWAGRVTTEITPSDNIFLRIMADITKDHSNAKHGYRLTPANLSGTRRLDDKYDTLAGAEENASTSGIDGNNEVTNKGISATFEWQASDQVTVKSITGYRDDYTESVIDFDSLAVDDFDAAVIYDNDQFTQEFQVLYTGDRIAAVTGFYYIDANAANDFDVVLGQLGRVLYGTELTAYTGGDVNTKSWSLFADVTYDLSDQLSLSAGGRYTNDKRTADVLRQSFLGVPSPFLGGSAVAIATTSDFENSRTFKKFSPRVTLHYKASEDVNVYAGYAQGFKAGGFDPRGANLVDGGEAVEEGFAPEVLDAFEVGVKATLMDGRARTNIALFHSTLTDMQIPGSLAIDTDGDGTNDDFVGTVTNAGQATIMGIEFEGQIAATDNLILTASFSLTDADIDEWFIDGVNQAENYEVQNTPDKMASIEANYSVPISSGSLNVIASWNHVGRIYQFETPTPLLDQDAYNIFNSSIVWSDEDNRYTVSLIGKNLLDKRYKVAGYNFPTLGFEGSVTAFYGPPRTITLNLGVNF